MLKLVTILDNPGEPHAGTRYRDPQHLRAIGYDGLVEYATTGLSGLMGPETVASADLRRWVTDQFEGIEQTLDDARRAGLTTWLAFDAPTLARELVGNAMTCVRNPASLCPASDELLEMCGESLDALLARFNAVDGVVLRLGDTDAHRVPYLVGNDLYAPHCARCNTLDRADRLIKWIDHFRRLVIDKLGKRLIVRAWGVRPGGLHDTPELAARVCQHFPPDDRLIFSFKFTQTDFWRYQRWNQASLTCGDRPIIYELQCQREFEGKGAVPNYQAPLWRDGMPELEGAFGLAHAAKTVNLAGLWAWARGGGWGGPFVTEETWIDINVFAAPRFAADPNADTDALAEQWIDDRLDCRDAAARSALLQTLRHSPQNVLDMFYIGPYARTRPDGWFPSGSFIQDDLLDADAGWQIIRRLPDRELDHVLAEKVAAVERIARDRRSIQQAAAHLVAPSGEALVHELEYTESLAETLRYLLAAMITSRRAGKGAGKGAGKAPDPSMDRILRDAVNHCQSYWNHHQRYANYKGTATAFRSDNLWDFTQQLVD